MDRQVKGGFLLAGAIILVVIGAMALANAILLRAELKAVAQLSHVSEIRTVVHRAALAAADLQAAAAAGREDEGPRGALAQLSGRLTRLARPGAAGAGDGVAAGIDRLAHAAAVAAGAGAGGIGPAVAAVRAAAGPELAAGLDAAEAAVTDRLGRLARIAEVALALLAPGAALAMWAIWRLRLAPRLARGAEARRRLIESEARARRLAREAEASSRAKSNFLAVVSHEIRTPMNGLLGFADLLMRRLDDPEDRRMARIIRESGQGLLRILDDVLDVSKIEAGKLELEEIAFRPEDVAREAEALHRLRAEEKGVALSLAVDGGGAEPRRGDPHRLLQIVSNLLSNAVKFTERGEVALTLDCRDPAWLRIAVRDTGIGMNEAEIARVFEEFSQADSSISRTHGGTGLGLSIVRRLAGLMGGEVSIESAPGVGTTVEVALAVAQAGPGALGQGTPGLFGPAASRAA